MMEMLTVNGEFSFSISKADRVLSMTQVNAFITRSSSLYAQTTVFLDLRSDTFTHNKCHSVWICSSSHSHTVWLYLLRQVYAAQFTDKANNLWYWNGGSWLVEALAFMACVLSPSPLCCHQEPFELTFCIFSF